MNNYVFPELATYKREWIPQLKAAKAWIENYKSVFVCNALVYAAKECEGSYYSEVADLIPEAIEGHYSVVSWLLANHPDDDEYDPRSYRLAWIDHMIEWCEENEPETHELTKK